MTEKAEATATKLCRNCKRDIAEANFVIHEVHCRRNIVLCDKCQEPVPKSDLDAHVLEFHTPVKCDLCDGLFAREVLEKHRAEECPQRLCSCVYCDLHYPAAEHAEHVEYCGSRTERCPLCNQFVRHRDQAVHEASNCQLPPVTVVPKPAAAVDLDCEDEVPPFWANEFSDPSCLYRGGFPLYGLDPGRGDLLERLDGVPYRRYSDVETDSGEFGRGVDLTYDRDIAASSGDDNCLPCEFCNESFPGEVLLQHQVYCKENPLVRQNDSYGVNLLTNATSSLPTEPPNFSRQPAVQPKPTIPFFNNLSHSRQHGARTGAHEVVTVDDGDEIMLPCEFCDELFPEAALQQHQGNCDVAHVTGMYTPMPARDDSDLRRHRAAAGSGASRSAFRSNVTSTVPQRASRHQGPPPPVSHPRSPSLDDPSTEDSQSSPLGTSSGGRRHLPSSFRPAAAAMPSASQNPSSVPAGRVHPRPTGQQNHTSAARFAGVSKASAGNASQHSYSRRPPLHGSESYRRPEMGHVSPSNLSAGGSRDVAASTMRTSASTTSRTGASSTSSSGGATISSHQRTSGSGQRRLSYNDRSTRNDQTRTGYVHGTSSSTRSSGERANTTRQNTFDSEGS